ncbi:SET domain-containing protein [Phthorimaea operculella]|nr:SET domain-containing protein [Phthorimaea operculella]
MYRVSYQVSAVVLDEVVGKLLRGAAEVLGVEEPPTADRRKPEDDECELFYQYNTARCPSGRFVTRLPFLPNRPALGWIKRFVNNCRKPQAERNFTPVLSPAERNAALCSLVRVVQAEHFEEEVRLLRDGLQIGGKEFENERMFRCREFRLFPIPVLLKYPEYLIPVILKLTKKRRHRSLANGANASAADNEGNCVIHWCALAGASRPLQLLLDSAPDTVNALNAHTDTPLHVAARQGHYACVIMLLARGARTDAENTAGEFPLDVCAREGQCYSAISLNMQMTVSVSEKLRKRRLLTSDISRGREELPIPCINEVDGAPLPEDFVYITKHVMPKTITIDNTIESSQGCKCSEDCSTAGCECCVLAVKRWWARGRLCPDFPYHDPPMLFECNQTCGCNAKKCTNSVITRLCNKGSVFVRAAVFRLGGARGWGLRTQSRIAKGTPVATYVGELLTIEDADTRSADQYMFALDVKQDLIEQLNEKTQLCVDAAQYGGAARFINHSCRPNLAPVRVFTNTRDLRLPVVALFAATDIPAGDELTFDYGDKFWRVKSKWMRCECAAPDCRYPTKAKQGDNDA